ncbi:Alpha/Beta hydrolase protein [Lentinula boryana]|uniref:Alpha/Beta hydrolase protein n=1 Tax=Lentinula boryana TaxID=40481 RepID=A0ABQ8Q985_9AGAR|nr:Alpha/Beta hydrolase protein [Lentinula boryana]
MTKLGITVFVLLSSTLVDASIYVRASNDTPIIDLGYAKYQGAFDSANNVTNYLGIRYAAPPTENLRWKAPQPPAVNISVVQLANTQPQACLQANQGESSTNPLENLDKRASASANPEDCLFLNVYFPGDTVPTESLPTLVWIHGGGYVAGDAASFTGSDLMREANNEIVLVIMQYRLGLFGFLAGSEVEENGDLNAGLLDQDFALRWVQTHISKFGGDPAKVTIWGESAGIVKNMIYHPGAGSVLQHIVAQDGRSSPQLFRGAITSSTFLPSQYFYNDTIPELLYSEVVSQAGCSSANDSLMCLRAVDATTLEAINSHINMEGFFGTFVFVPVVDGRFITQRPTEALKQGKINGKALLSFTNTNEGTTFVNQTDPITNVSLYASTLFPKFGSQQTQETEQLYANLGSSVQQDDLIMGESIFVCPTYYLLNAFAAFANSGWKVPVPPATHGSDLVYYFTSSLSQGTPAFNNTDFLAAFQDAFMSFVVSQNPNEKINSTITPFWNLYSQGDTEMVFNRTVDGQPDVHVNTTNQDLLRRCEWNVYHATSHGSFKARKSKWGKSLDCSNILLVLEFHHSPTQTSSRRSKGGSFDLTFILSLLCAVVSSAGAAGNSVPVIDLGYAQYQGAFDSTNNLTNYLGIRYAAPPIGDLRWKAPQSPAINNSVIQQANTQPSPCFQAPPGAASSNPYKLSKRAGADVTGDPTEDCLFLNVYFPGDVVPTVPLPTIVWIHGGGYLGGSAAIYTGSDLIRESKNGIVLVIIQYRLGVLGFLPGSEVKANGALNAGLLDQNFALRWVHTHISKFGGDPSKVTIWGESAGAGSVLQHVVAQDGQTSPQLFRGAITSSSFLPSQYMYNDSIPERLYSEVVSQANCSSKEDSLACLREVDATDLENINLAINEAGFFGLFVFVPVVDGSFITQRPTESLRQGKVNGKALLSVTNTNEGVIFVNETNPMNASLYASEVFPRFGPQVANVTARLYAPFGSLFVQDELIMGESIFICPTYYLLNAFQGNAWKGEFAIPPATHGSDVPYYFPSIEPPPFNNTDFLAAFQGAFLSFAVSQDPNEKIAQTITPYWELYARGNTEMVFNQTESNQTDIHVNTTSKYLLERCK